MKTTEKIKKLIDRIPDLNFEESKNYFSILPSDKKGFKVWMSIKDKYMTVGYDGWHEEFDIENDAIRCFIYGLTNKCRLKVFKRGKVVYKWIMQAFEDDQWLDFSSTIILFVPFWRKKEIIFLQNNISIEEILENPEIFPVN